MDNKENKQENKQTTTEGGFTKNALAAIGVIAVVKAVPVLAAGIAIGTVASKADQIKGYLAQLKEEYEQYCASEAEMEDGLFDDADPVEHDQASDEATTERKLELIAKLNRMIEELGAL